MIVWLVSFPRSGADVLRAIVRAGFDLSSYNSEEPVFDAGSVFERSVLPRLIEQRYPAAPWQEFAAAARLDADTHLFKSHRVPDDDSPVLLVVRDGRSALWSLYTYLQEHYPLAGVSLGDIIDGGSYYGSWSEHVRACRGAAPRLTLHYRDLVAGGDGLLASLEEFFGRSRVRDWRAIAERTRGIDPTFFSRRLTTWHHPPEWTAACDELFWRRHGDEMRALGYDE